MGKGCNARKARCILHRRHRWEDRSLGAHHLSRCAHRRSSRRWAKVAKTDNVSVFASFVADTAGKIGVSERTVYRDVQIGEKIVDDVRDASEMISLASFTADTARLMSLSGRKNRYDDSKTSCNTTIHG